MYKVTKTPKFEQPATFKCLHPMQGGLH
ncbi:hypothetical protein PIOMA14_II_0524 [Prevotella intermedia]|uniref:Uncharacterized protein n=1 Tax=Prevotella intermedia TaxID=28131 RepID=A0A0T7ANW6_PREIN|nr:hypothetical protein PIOMA14_II_0228 [Prevotella intermedia]BAU19029.1 hypothetical protein PIOMA14_II_0524 [Prevotella intermedia]